MSGGCIAKISRELRAPPNVCLRGTVRLPLASALDGGAPFGEACLRPVFSVSSGEVTFRLPLVCSVGTGGHRDKSSGYVLRRFVIHDKGRCVFCFLRQ